MVHWTDARPQPQSGPASASSAAPRSFSHSNLLSHSQVKYPVLGFEALGPDTRRCRGRPQRQMFILANV